MSHVYSVDKPPAYPKLECIAMLFAGFLSAMTPTLKLHMTAESLQERGFIPDEDYEELAYKTPQKIFSSDFGLIGSLKEGVKSGFPALIGRIQKRPDKFILGLVQLISCVALLALTLQVSCAVSAQAAAVNFIATQISNPCLFQGLSYLSSAAFYCILFTSSNNSGKDSLSP